MKCLIIFNTLEGLRRMSSKQPLDPRLRLSDKELQLAMNFISKFT